MTTLLNIFVPMDPKGKQRPRFTRNGHTYTPSETRHAETMIRLWAVHECGKREPHKGPVRLRVAAYFARPKTVKRFAHVIKPDWDNLGKLVSDALNGTVYADDQQITEAVVTKEYVSPGERAGFRIVVNTVDGGEAQ